MNISPCIFLKDVARRQQEICVNTEAAGKLVFEAAPDAPQVSGRRFKC